MSDLTEKQQEVLDYIALFIMEKKFPPTTREIADAMGFASQTAALNHMKALQKKGKIDWTANQARTITIL